MGEFFRIISLSVMTKSVCDPGNFFVLPLSFIQIAKISSYKELQEDYHLIADIQLREKRLPMWSPTKDVSWIYQRAIIARPRSTGYAPVDGLDAKLRLNLFFFLLPRCYVFTDSNNNNNLLENLKLLHLTSAGAISPENTVSRWVFNDYRIWLQHEYAQQSRRLK